LAILTLIKVVDLDEVRSYRQAKSRAMQARETLGYQRVEVNFSLSTHPEEFDFRVSPSKGFEPLYYKAEDEIMLGPGTWGRITTLSPTVS
jgi:NAD+ synthase (glutamine-hydrolysing)